MKKIICKLILAFAFVVSVGNINGQSLTDLINTALQHNYQIRIQKQAAEIASNNNTAGNAGQLPNVNFSGSYSGSLNNTRQALADGSVREGSNAKNTNLNLALLANWTIFNGFNVYAKKQQLNVLETLGQTEAKFYIEQTVADLLVSYYRLIYEKKVLENLEASRSVSYYRLKIEDKRLNMGSGKKIDHNQAKADYQSDSMRCMAQENRIQTLKVEFNRILGLSPEKELSINENTLAQLQVPDKDSILQMAERNNLQLNQMHLQELITELEMRLAASGAYPKVEVFGGYQYAGSTAEVGFVKSNHNYGPTLGLRVNFSLYNGGQNKSAIKNSKLYADNATLTREQLNLNIQAESVNAVLSHTSLKQQISIAESNVRIMLEVMETAKAQLNQGSISAYEFRIIQNSYLNSELAQSNLEFALKSAEININRLMGTVLNTYL